MTKRTESRGKRKHEPWQGATRALLLGCVAELYLLMIHKYYIYGNLDQVLAWDSYLRVSLWLGLGVAVLGGVLLYLCRRKPGWKRAVSGMVLELGAAWDKILQVNFYSDTEKMSSCGSFSQRFEGGTKLCLPLLQAISATALPLRWTGRS